jgi:hypothetical protein
MVGKSEASSDKDDPLNPTAPNIREIYKADGIKLSVHFFWKGTHFGQVCFKSKTNKDIYIKSIYDSVDNLTGRVMEGILATKPLPQRSSVD